MEILKFLGFDELVVGVGNKAGPNKKRNCPSGGRRIRSHRGLSAIRNRPRLIRFGVCAPNSTARRSSWTATSCTTTGSWPASATQLMKPVSPWTGTSRPSDDSVKICFRNGEIVDFHKQPTAPHDEFAEWIGFLKLSAGIAGRLEATLQPYIAAERTDFIYEEVFGDIMRASPPRRLRCCGCDRHALDRDRFSQRSRIRAQ